MTGSLIEEIVAKPQREIAGPDVASRFDYQKNWAFCRMLRKHSNESDYLVAFEFHDDVVFFDSESEPNEVEFIQVKTSKSPNPRKLSSLTAKIKGGHSIIGKMLLNLQGVCKDHSIKLILVSNNMFEFTLEDVNASEIDQKHQDKLLKKIKEEFPSMENKVLSSLHFHVSEIPVSEIETFLKGETLNLFTKRFGEDFTQNVSSWIRLIQGEIARRNNFPSDEISTVEELKSYKCLSRSFVDHSLDEVEKRHKNAPNTQHILDELQTCGWVLHERLQLDKALIQAVSDYKNPANSECITVCQHIEAHLDTLNISDLALSELLESTYLHLKAEDLLPGPYQGKMTAYALIILVYYEKL